jgi:hypothetical protein
MQSIFKRKGGQGGGRTDELCHCGVMMREMMTRGEACVGFLGTNS